MEAGLVKPTQPTVLVGVGRRVGRRLGWRHQPSEANPAYDPCRCRASSRAGVGWVGTINPAYAASDCHSLHHAWRSHTIHTSSQVSGAAYYRHSVWEGKSLSFNVSISA